MFHVKHKKGESMKNRFTRSNVGNMYASVVDYHREGDDVSGFLRTALQIGGNIGHGTRYIGMGGRMDVQYGPRGARKAVAYIYGMGAVVGAWDALRERDRIAFDSAMALVRGALRDLGDDTFAEWEDLGRHYVSKAR